MVWRAMTFFNLLISIAALVIAVKAYQRTGADLQLWETLQQEVQTVRRETTDALNRLEKFLQYKGGGTKGSQGR